MIELLQSNVDCYSFGIYSESKVSRIYYATNTRTRYTVRYFTLFSYAVRLHLLRNDRLCVVSSQIEVRNIGLATK